MVTGYSSRLDCFDQPLGHEAFGELTLGILKIKNRPAMAGVQQAFQLAFFIPSRADAHACVCHLAVQPNAHSHGESAAAAVLVESEQEV